MSNVDHLNDVVRNAAAGYVLLYVKPQSCRARDATRSGRSKSSSILGMKSLAGPFLTPFTMDVPGAVSSFDTSLLGCRCHSHIGAGRQSSGWLPHATTRVIMILLSRFPVFVNIPKSSGLLENV